MRSFIIDSALAEKDPVLFRTLSATAFDKLRHLSEFYPGFSEWYTRKVAPGLVTGTRKILLRYAGERLGGIAILKDEEGERKLCCLRVLPEYHGTGLGVRLFEDSFEVLATEKPLLTVAEEQLPQFQRIFDHFHFETGGRYVDLYRKARTEFSFNGVLFVPQWADAGIRMKHKNSLEGN